MRHASPNSRSPNGQICDGVFAANTPLAINRRSVACCSSGWRQAAYTGGAGAAARRAVQVGSHDSPAPSTSAGVNTAIAMNIASFFKPLDAALEFGANRELIQPFEIA